VLGGLLGCVCIATGFVFFVEKRKRTHAKAGGQGSRVVDALAVTTVTGMVIAAIGMLVATACCRAWRLRRSGDALAARRAWRDQAATIATLAMLAVAANAASTGDHLLRTIGAGYWPVAGVDLVLLGTALVAALTARRLAGLPLAARSAASQGDVRFAPDGIAR
jgi:hypothetical protein